MSGNAGREPMLDLFLFETSQLIEQLELIILNSEKDGVLSPESINEIFRIMHTIKGASAMMLYNSISRLTHSMEDVFYFLREQKLEDIDYGRIFELVFKVIDFVKGEIVEIENNATANNDPAYLVDEISEFLTSLKSNSDPEIISGDKGNVPTEKQRFYIGADNKTKTNDRKLFKAKIIFEADSGMENIRAFSVIHELKEIAEIIAYEPQDIVESEESVEKIRKEGFEVIFATDMSMNEAKEHLDKTVLLKELEISEVSGIEKPNEKKIVVEDKVSDKVQEGQKADTSTNIKQSYISVNVQKLDKLMDMVGEIVISEAMVTMNPEVTKLNIESFQKASQHLRKMIAELQDMVMSVRMVPLSATFQKMNRIVRDMSKKLNKEVELEMIGEETEVDKNVIEHISDPLMHIIRNSIDHGIETHQERKLNGKRGAGKIVLEARNSGGEVIISIKDDGRGLDKSRIYEKAYKNKLTNKTEDELTEKEIFSFIFQPGFSMKENITEFSGRGVGMDVVSRNIWKVGGTVEVESEKDVGTTISLKIPLTLAIIDGMILTVGYSSYIIPTISIKESFKPEENDIITDPEGNEMILIRGKCYPVIRLHRRFGTQTKVTEIPEGILLMVEDGDFSACIFADVLVGEQQIVVKPLPNYLKKVNGLSGCTLLGDGSISLIIDVGEIIRNNK